MPSAVTPLDLDYPFQGRWLVQNSPANRVPSHGTARFGTSYAIDFVPVDEAGRSARLSIGSLLRPEPPERFPGFGRPILAPIDGVVAAVHDEEPDHRAYRGLPSIGYALTQSGRIALGWRALAGNHVLLDCGSALVALCHLQRGSLRVGAGEPVHRGDVLAGCGNSGNGTEPHLHVQAIDRLDVERAQAVPLRFGGELPRNGRIVQGRPGT